MFQIGSVLGFTLILVAGIIQGALFPEVFDLDWAVWFAAITMPLFSFLVGFFIPWMFCLDHPQRVAIAMEVSLQNVTLAVTIVTVAFPNAEVASYYSQYIILYGAFQIVIGTGLSILFQTIIRYFEKRTLCHRYIRWKEEKSKALTPDLQQVTTNGNTLREDPANAPQPPQGLTNMTYTGSSLDLPQMETDVTGSGFVPDGKVSSTTELIRMDSTMSTNSENELLNNGTAAVVIQRMDSCESSEGPINFSVDDGTMTASL